eukprot:c9198_g1_i1.p1 GENE.c9198_g1_i1~~c9198_g1_i1.p1  ORF type:complete len:313 (+),score=55.97 c9198_g1_i1:36-941(+)
MTTSTVVDLVAGTTGGVLAMAALYPLDLLKVRYQAHKTSATPYPSLRVAVVSIVRREGFSALYQGLTPALVGSGVSWGAYFYFYEGIKQRLLRENPAGLTSIHHITASVQAGALLVFVTNPIWLIKTRMQLQIKHAAEVAASGAKLTVKPYRGMLDAGATIVREEGFLGLYRGTFSALLLTSHGAVQFAVYEKFKVWAKDLDMEGRFFSRSALTFAMGASSKLIAACVTYPYQVVKTRVQERQSQYAGTNDFTRTINCVRTMWRAEGVRGFFKGCFTNAIRVAPSSAVTILCYEETKKLLS